MTKSKLMSSLALAGVISCSTLLGQQDNSSKNKNSMNNNNTEQMKNNTQQSDYNRPKQDHPYVLVEGKAGYFFPTSSKFKNIYGGSGIYGYDVSVQAWKGLYVWTSASYFGKTGHSEGLHDKTKMIMVPIDLGLKYNWQFNIVDFYVGAAGVATYLHLHDESPYVKQKTNKWGGGGNARAGFLFNLPARFYIDIYGDYYFMWVPYSNTNGGTVTANTANLSGASVGGGVGYRF